MGRLACWLIAAGALLSPSPGSAAVFYDAFASASLTLAGVSGAPGAAMISVEGETASDAPPATDGGFADGAADFSLPPTGVSGTAEAFGSVTGLFGTASSLYAALPTLTAFNSSETEDLVLDFVLDYALGAAVQGPPPERGFAGASALVLLDSVLFGLLADDAVDLFSLEGPSERGAEDSVAVRLTLEPGQSDELALVVLAEGEIAVVPLAPTAGFLVTSLAAFLGAAARPARPRLPPLTEEAA